MNTLMRVGDSRENCNAIIETSTNTLIVGCQSTIIPNSVTSIGREAFGGCSITSVTIPDLVTSIGDYAFYGCSSLTNITIPESVTTIGSYVFYDCNKLSTINFTGSIEQWNTITKGIYWKYNVPATVVHCTDGNITL